jgi:phosphoglycerate kinase
MADAGATPGLRGIKLISELELREKRVFLRVDFNVPMEGGKITDETRILAALPTLKFALEKGAKLVVASHLGRPLNKPESRADDRKQFSMEPIAARLNKLLNMDVVLVDDPASDAPKGLLPGLRPNQLILLENLRFADGETKNARDFALRMASYTDVYVNDAFGASHRAHASIEALPEAVEQKGIGFLIEKEIKFLDMLSRQPARPYLAILGGAKASDKIKFFENSIDLIDAYLVGGAMAYTFLAAEKVAIGKSRVEKDKIAFAGEMINRIKARDKRVFLPVDHVVTQDLGSGAFKVTDGPAIPEGWMGVDIGPKTIELYRRELQKAKTVFWNGPMGVFENEHYAKGTFAVAEALANLSGATTVVGGGDSAAAAEASGFAEKMSHISTGGGASLEYLQGEKLPGLEVLRQTKAPAGALREF